MVQLISHITEGFPRIFPAHIPHFGSKIKKKLEENWKNDA